MQLITIVEHFNDLGLEVELVGSSEVTIQQVASLETATANQISFLNDKKYVHFLEKTQAGAVILNRANSAVCPVPHLIVDNPYYAYALVAQLLNPFEFSAGIDDSASVASSAKVSKGVAIEAQAVIQAGAVIGEGSYIGSGAVIEKNATIGSNCRIGSNVVICHGCVIGNHVIIEAGSIIGGDGFGWAAHQGQWVKIPQIGKVVIGDHVSIGNNVCIDRGAIGDTVIANHCIIDNLVHMAHNVKLGEGCAIAGQVGFAGSTTLGAHCTVAGQAGFAGHITVTDGAHFLAKAGVTHSLDQAGVYAGFPAIAASDWQKNSVRARNLDKMSKQMKALQKQVDALTTQLENK